MNRARLRELGFELGARAEGGVSDDGAWFATAPDGAPVVLKWFPDETVAERYAVLLPGLDELRSRGVPVPEYPHVLAIDGWTLRSRSCRWRRCATRHGRWWGRWSSASPPWPVSSEPPPPTGIRPPHELGLG